MSSPVWRRRRSKRRLRELFAHLDTSFIKYHDRRGREIPLWRWTWYFEQYDYRRVAMSTIGDITVSTIWDGMDMDSLFIPGPPCIFETGVNRDGRWDIVGRWSSEAIAREGHAECVRALS